MRVEPKRITLACGCSHLTLLMQVSDCRNCYLQPYLIAYLWLQVIKEIRAMTNLGLKEAKELVEKAPVIVKGGIPKAEAEEMQKKLEAAGGKVTID